MKSIQMIVAILVFTAVCVSAGYYKNLMPICYDKDGYCEIGNACRKGFTCDVNQPYGCKGAKCCIRDQVYNTYEPQGYNSYRHW
ncbi:Hypothetical predicted protein [Mytilus galloprovincialis]|uniref:Uncharacterized protein n=1 Tax=Mytilus galloprovincialis TaxID=29158 RepID=A0A8B6F5H6_MYTGA|nr:Hypothetical predicted protein [Mytilus galloprovincialis]